MKTQTIKIDGMTCNHCKANVESNLEQLSFIDKAEVNLGNKSVELIGDHIDLSKVKETIEGLGYKPE